ncbi:MAG: cytochrome c oxidase assembly protein [Alphaproteobacteria bacterium]
MSVATETGRAARSGGRNRATMLSLIFLVVGMVGMAYAAVPLYRVFCQVTGYGGTTQRAGAAPGAVAGRPIAVRFDANVNSALPWRFRPLQREVVVRPGEQTLAFFRATNLSDRAVTGTATFNVTPLKAGIYFNKIDCFCFTEQHLAPGESIDMPVSFFVDPEMLADRNVEDVKTITLSYTFFAVNEPAAKATPRQATPAG